MNQLNDTDEEFRSSDIGLCAFLLTKGHNLLRLEPNNKKTTFVFSITGVKNDPLLYLNGRGTVEPAAFLTSIRKLKAAISQQ